MLVITRTEGKKKKDKILTILAKYSVYWACFPKTGLLLYVIQPVACKVQINNQDKIELQISGNVSNIKGKIIIKKNPN